MSENHKNFVSIIIPTFNRAHLIEQTLDSILNQTYKNWECLIVDDGSTDNTQEIVEKYIKLNSSIKYFKRPIHLQKGPNSCRNFGFQNSKGDYIKWFDSDDVMYPNLLEQQILSFSKDTDMSVCKLEYFNFEKNISIKENSINSDNLIVDYIRGKISYYTFSPTWKRTFLEKQNELFDESISNLDDWDFNLRMLYNNPVIAFIDTVLIKYRIHSESLSQKINQLDFKELQSEFKAREKHVILLQNNKVVNSIILKKFISERYKFILRDAVVINHPQKLYFFKKLLISQIQLNDINGFFKTLYGYFIYSIFKKGYKLLS